MENVAEEDEDCQQSLSTSASETELPTETTPNSKSNNLETTQSLGITPEVENDTVASVSSSSDVLDKVDRAVSTENQSSTAPGKPVACEIGNDFIILEWKKPSDCNISYYEIRFRTKTETTWCRPVFSDFSRHRMRDLVPGTEYEFKVRPQYQDREGEFSEKSEPIKTRPKDAESVLDYTSTLTRKPGKPFALHVDEDHITIGWDKPKENNVTYYEIEFKSSEDASWSEPVVTENANAFFMIGRLLPDTEYKFKVKSHYQTLDGVWGDVSDVLRTKKAEKVKLLHNTATLPGKPAALDIGCDFACIAWDKPDKRDVEYYEVKIKMTPDNTWLKMSSFTDDCKPYKKVTDLTPGTTYEFKVRGHYQDYEGEFSEKSDPILTKQSSLMNIGFDNTVEATYLPLQKPGKPYILGSGNGYVDLGWEKPRDKSVTYYELKKKSATSKAWDKMPVFTDDAKTFCRISRLSHSTKYVFKVRAHFLEEEGQFSDESDVITTSENLMEEENSMSVVRFQESFDYKDNLSKSPSGQAQYLAPNENTGYSIKNAGLGQGQVMISELDFQRNTKLSPFRNDHYLFHGPLSGTFSPFAGSSTKDSKLMCSRQPSKPTWTDRGSDYVCLTWVYRDSDVALYYEVKYRPTQDDLWCKNSITTEDNSPQILVRGLLQDTEYTFKVRAHCRDREGDFSEQSDPIRTKESPALSVRNVCSKLQDGEPAFYKLPLMENKAARNVKYRSRKCEFGSSKSSLLNHEKTIMMIGATGSGKSTLIDGMVNYLLGVKWEDDFRFKIIDLTTEEEARKGLETESQTDWITSYRVHPMNKTHQYICNIIDTPGFGDTRGIERDNQLVDQIRAFFNTQGIQGIETIDAICFVTQAPLARLTPTQRYIYDSILSIFGKDMKDNIVAMVTFADGKEPPVLNALLQAEIPIKMHFVFNNSALFEPNTDGKCNRFGRMFWEMGFLSYGGFFNFLPLMKTQSLQLTAEVLQTREQLNTTVAGLLPQIDMGLGELAIMKTEKELLDKHEREIKDNQNFTYEVDEFHQQKISLKPGEYVTNCTFCHYTCHYPCHVSNDSDKFKCAAMSKGKCTVCTEKCAWTSHRNNDFRIEVTQVRVKKTYEQMKRKLEIAKEAKVSKEHVLTRLVKKILSVRDKVCSMIGTVRDCGNYLRQNAIKTNPLTELEYLDVLIKSEQQQKKPGYTQRLDMLRMLKRSTELKAKSIRMTPEEMLAEFGLHDDNM